MSAPRRGILTERVDVGRSSMRTGAQRAGVAWVQRRGFSEEIMIPVPSMGDSITEGDLGTIFFQVGDAVNMDDVIAEIETDKVTSEVKAPTSGTITAILAEEGDAVTVNQELFMLAPGEGAPAVAAPAPAPAPAAAPPAPSPAAAPAAAAAAPAADSHGRKPMIQFRYGHNKLAAMAAAAASGAASAYSGAGLLIEYKTHIDPEPAVLRAERRRGSAFTEEEIEAFNLGGWE
eukprot:COSAG02_NODE_15901_length_1132_cov_0.999032_1_plen_232_part_00